MRRNSFNHMKPEQTIDFHIRWAWAKMNRTYNAEAAKVGASMAMGYALLSIEKGGTPSTQLGPKMGIEPTSLTRMLNNLESQGYIQRVQSKDDKRVVYVHLTAKGKKFRDLTKQKVIHFNKHLQEKLPKNKLAVFF